MQAYPAPSDQNPRRPLSAADFVALFIPMTQFVRVAGVGEIYGPDIGYLLILPFLLAASGHRLFQGPMKTAIPLILLWLLGAIVTDVFRGTDTEDIARGWSKIILFGLILASVYLLVAGDMRRIALLLTGQGIGQMLEAFINPNSLAEYDPWKFGVGAGVATTSLLFVSIFFAGNLIQRLIGAFLIACVGAASLYIGSRSLFGQLMITSIIFLLNSAFVASKIRRISIGQLAAILVVGLVFVNITISAYSFLASSGALGLEAQDKFEAQSAGGNLILGGRAESVISIRAFLDSPILGHGSWARDVYYVAMWLDIVEANGVEVLGDPFKETLIPTHSHLMGGLVEAGILAGPIWLWALWIAARALYFLLTMRTPYVPVAAYALIVLLWDIPFSPFGALMRFLTATKLCLAIVIIEQCLAARSTTSRPSPSSSHRFATSTGLQRSRQA